MRIYNPRKFPINIPLDSGARLFVKPGEVSASFMPSTRVLNLIVQSYSVNDIALIIDGSSEYDICASISSVPAYTFSSLSQALDKFTRKETIKTVTTEFNTTNSESNPDVVQVNSSVESEIESTRVRRRRPKDSDSVDVEKDNVADSSEITE